MLVGAVIVVSLLWWFGGCGEIITVTQVCGAAASAAVLMGAVVGAAD